MNKTTKIYLYICTSLIVLSLLAGAMPQVALAQSSAPTVTDDTQSLYLPVLADDACSSLRDASSVFGIQVYGRTGRTQANFPYLQGTAANWLRVTLHWSEVVKNPASPLVFDFTQADSVFAAARDACVNIMATIEWRTFWNAGDEIVPFDVARQEDFAAFMKALVERYDGDGVDDNPSGIVVHQFELYNEPDYDARWGKHGADYAAMLKKAYPAVKLASPEAKVVFGGVAYDAFTDRADGRGRFVRSFVEDVLKAGGGAYFDTMNFHYYPGFRGDWITDGNKSTGLAEKLANLKALLAKYNHPDKDFVVTETSWPSNSLDGQPSSEEQQSRFVVQLYTQALAFDIDVMIWWLLQDATMSGGVLQPRQSGLVTSIAPIRPKQAYYVFRNAGVWLGNAEYVATASQVSGSNDLEAYQFRSKPSGKTFYVAWLNPIGDNATKAFEFSAQKATVYDFEGKQIAALTHGGNGKITVQVDGNPIYILVD